jgi:hypothetical protein
MARRWVGDRRRALCNLLRRLGANAPRAITAIWVASEAIRTNDQETETFPLRALTILPVKRNTTLQALAVEALNDLLSNTRSARP